MSEAFRVVSFLGSVAEVVRSTLCGVVASILSFCSVLANAAWAQPSVSRKLIEEGHYRRALPLVMAELEKQPHDVDALVALSTIQWSYSQLDASLRTAEKTVAAAADRASAHAQLVNALGAKLASSRTDTLEKLSLSRRFRREVERTLQLDPNNVFALEAMARFCWYAPTLGGRDRKQALRLIERLILVDAVEGYALKAELDSSDLDKSKCPAAVQADWRQAIEARPESYKAHTGLAGCLLTSGRDKLALAESEANKALGLAPTRITAHQLIAQVRVRKAQWLDLDAGIRRAQAFAPDDLSTEYFAAEAILEQNVSAQLPRAERYMRDYLTQPAEGLAPTWAMAHWKLGLILERQGRRAEAVQELKAATGLDATLDGARIELNRLR